MASGNLIVKIKIDVIYLRKEIKKALLTICKLQYGFKRFFMLEYWKVKLNCL